MFSTIWKALEIIGPFAAIVLIASAYQNWLGSRRFWRRKDLISKFLGAAGLVCVSVGIALAKDTREFDTREKVLYSGACFIGACCLAVSTAKEWKERINLEKHWSDLMADKARVQDIQKNHRAYRDDFKKWIEWNHPLLATWTNPPHSQN